MIEPYCEINIMSVFDIDSFQIDPSTGLITLAKKVSYSITGQYIILTIKATDQTNQSATTKLRIQVVDSSQRGPTFNPLVMDVVVLEGQTGLTPPASFMVGSANFRSLLACWTLNCDVGCSDYCQG